MGHRKGVSECRHEGCLHAHTKQLIHPVLGVAASAQKSKDYKNLHNLVEV